jgi:hypothetical protein
MYPKLSGNGMFREIFVQELPTSRFSRDPFQNETDALSRRAIKS